jgi:hypothetical protein
MLGFMMNRLNLVLAATTLVLAGITVHFAVAARTQRAQNDQSVTGTARLDGSLANPEPRFTPDNSVAQVAATSTEEDGKPARDTRFDPDTLALARYRLDELRDPHGRAQRLKELAALFRSGMAGAIPYIGMSPDDLQRYAELRAELNLRGLVRNLECQIDPACDITAMRASRQAEAKREEAMALGPAMSARLKAFQAAFHERRLVNALQKALPATSALTSAQAEELALALSEETQKFDAQARQSGKTMLEYIGWNAIELRSAASPGAADEIAQRRESAARHQRMLYDKAVSLLTTTQLREFKSMQDEAIARYMEQLREDEIAANARKTGGK